MRPPSKLDLDPQRRPTTFDEALRLTGEFHMGTSPVHATLRSVARRLDELHIPWAVVGAMALNAHGCNAPRSMSTYCSPKRDWRRSRRRGSVGGTSSVSPAVAA